MPCSSRFSETGQDIRVPRYRVLLSVVVYAPLPILPSSRRVCLPVSQSVRLSVGLSWRGPRSGASGGPCERLIKADSTTAEADVLEKRIKRGGGNGAVSQTSDAVWESGERERLRETQMRKRGGDGEEEKDTTTVAVQIGEEGRERREGKREHDINKRSLRGLADVYV